MKWGERKKELEAEMAATSKRLQEAKQQAGADVLNGKTAKQASKKVLEIQAELETLEIAIDAVTEQAEAERKEAAEKKRKEGQKEINKLEKQAQALRDELAAAIENTLDILNQIMEVKKENWRIASVTGADGFKILLNQDDIRLLLWKIQKRWF